MNTSNYMTAHEIAAELLKLPEDTVVMFLNEKENKYERIETITCSGYVKDIQRIENACETGMTHEQEQAMLEAIRQSSPSMWAIFNVKQITDK